MAYLSMPKIGDRKSHCLLEYVEAMQEPLENVIFAEKEKVDILKLDESSYR